MKTNYYYHSLPNGIRYIHLPSDRVIAHTIAIINTGSRDEKLDEHGLAHFIEHLMFKGTKKRNSFQILNRIESVGGEMDAYTSKEDTCIIASFLPQYFSRTLELISDIIFNSTFPDNQIALEKKVIIDEINSYYDSPYELIYDDFEEIIFDGHSLARNILGTKESIRKFNNEIISKFCKRTYNTDQIVICTTGNIDQEKALKNFVKYFQDIPSSFRNWKRKKFENYVPKEKVIEKKIHQSHCIIGNIGYSFKNKNRLGLHLLNNILGVGSSSRLNLNLRERNGLVYLIESGYTPYSDSGIFYIYFATDKDNLSKSIKLVKDELTRLRNIPLSKQQLNKAKEQFKGQLALSYDNQESYSLNVAKSFLIFNKIDDYNSIIEELNSVTSEDIQRIANEILDEEKLSCLIYTSK